MRRKTFSLVISTLLLCVFFSGALAYAGAEEIKERMKQRKPAIDDLKAQGLVGEGNNGYLQLVGENTTGADIVAEENNDRKEVYEAIAQQQGTTVENVGKRRALQIAEKANPGEWLQDESGQWYQK